MHPDEEIEPYDKTLNNMNNPEREVWANKTITMLEKHLDGVSSVVFFAGKDYRKFLKTELINRGIHVYAPMEGLRIAERKAWLDNQIRSIERNAFSKSH